MQGRPICQFFLQGTCKFGKECHNQHIIPPNMQQNHPHGTPQNPNAHHARSSTCRFFLKNACKNPNCPFFHGYDDQLQFVNIIRNDKEINNLIKMDEIKYIISDYESFTVHFNGSDEIVKKSLNKEGFKIGKMVFSGNKVIFSLIKEG